MTTRDSGLGDCFALAFQSSAAAAAGLRDLARFCLRVREGPGPRSTVINGSDLLRRWVDDPAATPADLEADDGPPTKAAGAAGARGGAFFTDGIHRV